MSHFLSPGQVLEPEPQPEAPKDWQQNLNVRLICQECREDPPNLYEDTSAGDMICETCGLVLQQRGVDMRAEWRTFANDDQGNDDPSRVGDAPNLLLNGDQLQTSIAFGDGSMRSKDLHRAQSKVTADKGNKLLLQAFKQIGALCDGHHLPQSVADGAKHIFKDAEESGKFKAKPQLAVIAGCIFIACRRNHHPRSFREIFDMTKVPKKEIGRTFKLLENFLQQQDNLKTGVTKVIGNGKSPIFLSILYCETELICVLKVSLPSTKPIKLRPPPAPISFARVMEVLLDSAIVVSRLRCR